MALSILDFQTEMVVQFPTRNTKKATLEYRRIIQMPTVFLTISSLIWVGGFVEGEQYQVTIDVNKDAHALVTTQTPTYVYKCERGQLTQQHTSITLEENSYLEYMADEVIPYLRSRYFQTSRIDMDKSAHLIYSDGVTAGWSHEDLPFQYHYFRNLTQIYQDNELVYSDQTLLEPQKQDMFKLGYLKAGVIIIVW